MLIPIPVIIGAVLLVALLIYIVVRQDAEITELSTRSDLNASFNRKVWESRQAARALAEDLYWHLERCGSVIASQEAELERYRRQRGADGRFMSKKPVALRTVWEGEFIVDVDLAKETPKQ